MGSGWGVRVDVNRSEVFVKIQKKNILEGGGVRSGGWGRGSDQVRGGQGGCERRTEVFVKIQKRMGGRGVRVGEDSGWGCSGWGSGWM